MKIRSALLGSLALSSLTSSAFAAEFGNVISLDNGGDFDSFLRGTSACSAVAMYSDGSGIFDGDPGGHMSPAIVDKIDYDQLISDQGAGAHQASSDSGGIVGLHESFNCYVGIDVGRGHQALCTGKVLGGGDLGLDPFNGFGDDYVGRALAG